jgi:hypothetical protein
MTDCVNRPKFDRLAIDPCDFVLNIFVEEMYIDIHLLSIEIVNNFLCESIDIAAISIYA